MEESSSDKETLLAHIQQLEHERDELHKDIEQLCMQQAGPGYLVVATKMHFQRTAGLEQEIENLKKKLTACTRENLNLQEELSEAYQIKTQLADLHSAEVTKNKEAEKQLKFFQGCVAAAFAERDHSIMEAEKAKEKEELMSQKLNENQTRLEELTQDCLELKKKNDSLLINIAKEEERNEIFKTIIDKFYEIRQQSSEGPEDLRWDDKCACLLDDPAESWTYNDPSTSKYINALEEEVDTLRNSMENLRNKFQMGLEIEKHLKKRVRELEKKMIRSDKRIKNELTGLQQCHSLHRANIRKLLDEEKSRIKSIIDAVEENIKQFVSDRGRNSEASRADVNLNENECRDVHVSADLDANFVAERNAPVSPDVVEYGNLRAAEALTQALQDKVQTLLLLSQQEERHLLERNVNAALQKKVEELQRNLQQVTNEKVKALMDFAQLKQEYQLLREKTGPEMRQRNVSPDAGERRVVAYERDGRLRNLLKKSYLKRWVGTMDFRGGESESNLNSEGNVSGGKSNSTMDFARMRVENATLKESLESIEHLTSSVHRLRLSLLKAKELLASEGTEASAHDTLDSIIKEAKIIKTALGSSLPVSWSAEADLASLGESACNETSDDISGDSRSEKMESVSAAGFEMVELLILASEILKHDTIGPGSEGGS